MRRLCKITLLIIIMTLTTVTASADKYSHAWEKVEQLIKEDQPESAAKVINQIWDMASNDNDGRQMLKSAVYLTRVQQTYTEKSITDGIELFSSLLPVLKVQEHKALCHAFLAKGYMTYWERNKYNSRRILPSDEENPPLEHWTPKMICDTICYHLDQSIKLAGDVGSGFYEEFFPGGNKAGKKLRPLLVDMLMDNAVVLITDYRLPLGKRKFFDDSRLYGSMGDFLEATREIKADDPDLWQFYVLRQLVNHNFAAKPNIRCTIDIRRMQVLNEYLDNDGKWDSNDEEWLKGAVALAQSYSKKVKFSTMLYSLAAGKIMDNLYQLSDEKTAGLLRQARDICIAAQNKWPKSEGALECMGIRSEIERRTVNVEFLQDFLPGERNIARIDYKNVSSVYIKVVEVPGKFTYGSQVDQLSQMNQCNAVAEWSMSVNNPGDYMEHHTMINIPPVMQGCYYLMVSTGPYFDSGDCISYRYVECNGIQFVKLVENNGILHGIAINTRTGQPIPDCKYTLWRCNSEGIAQRNVTSGITPADGSIFLEGYYNGTFKLELEKGNEQGNAIFQIPYSSDMPDRDYINLYTDRYTYLPGDSVQLSGVLYHKNSSGDKGYVCSNRKVSVYVRGSREEILLGTYTTDEMGSFRLSYKIPDNYMPGNLNFRATKTDDYYTNEGWKSVNVESFRQPKFQVEFDECRDEVFYDKAVTVTGHAKSYTGVPIDSASVEWYAGVSPYLCHRFCITDDRGYVRVGAGEIKADDDGTFSFNVTVPSEMMLETSGQVYVTAKVTDINGEIHESVLYFSAAQEPGRNVIIQAGSGVIDRNGQKALSFRLQSNNGPVSGHINVKVSRLIWLEKPGLELPFRTKSWAKELSAAADNMNLKERFPLYDFDFNGDNIAEQVVFEGVVPFDRDDPESMLLILDNLQSGEYRITADAPGFQGSKQEITLCREDDYDFVPLKPLLWAFDGNNGATRKVEVGDTARIRLGNSRKGTIIHYYIENKYGVVRRGKLESNGHQQVLNIPVTPEFKGYFSVSCCVLYEGVSENKSFVFEVPDRDKQLKVKLTTFRSLVEPDTDEEWKLAVTDWEGNPVKAAIILDMYDRALDEYGNNSMIFQPFNPRYVGGRTLLDRKRITASQYRAWEHMFGNPYEYKGKRAITGMLIDPFQYYSGGRMYKGAGLPVPLREGSRNVQTINMADFEGLGITTVDEALQGSVAGLDIVFDSGDLGARSSLRLRGAGLDDADVQEDVMGSVEIVADRVADYGAAMVALNDNQLQNAVAEQKAVLLRSDLNPTGLFEYIVTDSTGTASVHFRTPQLLTEWKVQGISYTDSLKSGRMDTTLVTRKLIMVEPASPRFLREGDRMEFTVKVSNLTDIAQKATVIMTLTDAVTGKVLSIIEGGNKKNVTIPVGGNAGTSFIINVPAGVTAVTYRLTAQAQDHSDGMEETIPVLSNRTQVVQSLSLFNNGSEKRSFHFEVLDRPRSTTMEGEQLTLEYSATPIWYAIQSLPIMIRLGDISTLSFFYSMMGAAISQDLCRRYPVITEMLDEWSKLPASSWQTQLEHNQNLTGTLLEETPWVFSNRSERDRLHDLAVNLGTDKTYDALDYSMGRIIGTQNYDGGWSWIPGFPGTSIYVTREIMSGLGLLIENGILDETPEIRRVVQKGIDYLDNYYFKEYSGRNKPESLGYDELYYLLIRSYFSDYKFSGTTNASHTYFTRLADIQDTHDLNIFYRAQLALLMARTGKKQQAEHITTTLVERSLYDDEMGRYWRDNTGGVMWHEAPIETQTTIIRLLLAVGRNTEAVESARWLLKQKQTTGWGSSPATAQAVTALLAVGGNAQLESDPDITIYVGKDAIQASTSKAMAGFTTQTWSGPISRDKADITVDAKTAGISWGAVYRTFTETLDKVEHQENGMKLKRTIWRVIHGADGDRLEEVKPGTKLHVGDQLRVHFDLETDRNLEYVQLADMRAAAVEPMSTHAGYIYNWHDDIRYYVAPNNSRNVFYIDRLSKGSYAIEYDVKVQKPGRFTVGIAVMQCLYAPAFRATTTSTVITVE